MIKIFLTQDSKRSDITSFVSTITWAGSKSNAARSLSIQLVNSVLDYYIPDLYIKNGNMIELVVEDKVLFMGFVFFNERNGNAGDITITAYDHLIYTLKSEGTYNFKDKTAEDITRTVCGDVQIPIGNLAQTGIPQKLLVKSKKIYDIIMQGYTGASKQNGAKYMPVMNNGKLDVIQIGSMISTFILSDTTSIIDSSYTESIEGMVNVVRIYDSDGNALDVVQNADWVKAYGILQSVYTKEKDKEAKAVAKEMLEDVKKTVKITATGDVTCVTGKGIQVRDEGANLSGLFFIDSDTHTWSNGQHIMKLHLTFENIMDEK